MVEDKKTIICVLGETCSGKDTFVKMMDIYTKGFCKAVVSYTNRPIRPTEVDGREHYFVSKDEFDKIRNERSDDVIAYTKISATENSDGYEYMALSDELANKIFYVIDPKGLYMLKEKCKDKFDVMSIYIYCDEKTRRDRAIKRGDNLEVFDKRIKAESEQFKKFRENRDYDFLINNTDGNNESAFSLFKNIVSKISYKNELLKLKNG